MGASSEQGFLGNDVHITRKDIWYAEGGPAISRAEWFHLISRDPSLQLARDVIVENAQGEKVSLQEPTLTVWLEWPHRVEGRAEALFWHSDGNVSAKAPDLDTRCKMYVIAAAFQAQLQNDQGEVYGARGEVVTPRARAWWRFW